MCLHSIFPTFIPIPLPSFVSCHRLKEQKAWSVSSQKKQVFGCVASSYNSAHMPERTMWTALWVGIWSWVCLFEGNEMVKLWVLRPRLDVALLEFDRSDANTDVYLARWRNRMPCTPDRIFVVTRGNGCCLLSLNITLNCFTVRHATAGDVIHGRFTEDS